ncbi:MAG TPA: hypothetical protein VEA78_06925, partial [Acidimicrobiales bacterium]|nr:hypothetical protein [Acidimicrobiales bacterium]
MAVGWRSGTGAAYGKSILTTDHWNDSLLADHLWSSGNVIEAIPDVMTTVTQSAFELLALDAVGPRTVGRQPLWGTIAGRFYFDLSTTFAVADTLRMGAMVRELADQSLGLLPEGVDVPPVDLPLLTTVRTAGLHGMRTHASTTLRRGAFHRRALAVPARCAGATRRIAGCRSTDDLLTCWRDVVAPLAAEGRRLMRHSQPAAMRMALTHRALRRLVGDDDANALTGTGAELGSLGLLLGLEALDSGAIDSDTFAERHGHRGPREVELSVSRPGEDPAWVDAQRR